MNQGERMPCKIEFLVDIVVEPDESEFLAYCPALKGLHVGGATVKEATENANDAIACHLTSMMKHGDPIPKGVSVRRIQLPDGRLRHTTSTAGARTADRRRRTRRVSTAVSLAFA
jgi:predicted RNase H-like HicB family nuclease